MSNTNEHRVLACVAAAVLLAVGYPWSDSNLSAQESFPVHVDEPVDGDDPRAKQSLLNDPTLGAILTGGNGIYTVYVRTTTTCGPWTARTAALHPAGPNLNVIFGNGSPSTSYTTLRSYDSGIDYVTRSVAGCTSICVAAGAPVVTAIMNGPTVVGYSLEWTLVDSGSSIRFTQEVVVEGPVDGSETIDNTVVRETHTVENLGLGVFSYGLRKMWDWQIGPDDGPSFGDCDSPTTACDRSVNLTADGSENGMYPQSYVINTSPGVPVCPGGLIPFEPGGCGGSPIYLVAGTVTPPSNLVPPPDAPELLQFNRWSSLYSGTCWEPTLTDNANCVGGDTAVAYFYGRTAGSALTLAAGQQRSFTQYIVAGDETCPDVVTPGACCNDTTGTCTIETSSSCTFRYGGDGSDCVTIDPPCQVGCPCNADLVPPGGNGIVNLDDLLTVLSCLCSGVVNPACDIDCNGVADFNDFGIALCQFATFGPSCCEATLGACLGIPFSCCVETTALGCSAFGGTYLGDGTTCPAFGDCDNNGVSDQCQSDCDCDGVADVCELVDNDCNMNGLPDDCEGGGTVGCDGDVNDDNMVNACDLFLVGLCTGCADPPPNPPCAIPPNLACDVNCDGVENLRDFGDEQCLLYLPAAQCCDPLHGACTGTTVFQGCIEAPEGFCISFGGDYQGDGTHCPEAQGDCNGNGIGDACEPMQCMIDADCNDGDGCTCDLCVCNVCVHQPRQYGDTNCDCIPPNLDDILCVLRCFSTAGVECPNADISFPCSGDGDCDVDDILAVLSAFAGTNPCFGTCSTPCPIGACCDGLSCRVTTAPICLTAGDAFKGNGSACPPLVPTPCP